MDETKTSDHIHINIRILNPSQKPPVSSKAKNQDLNDMAALCTFKTKTESQNFDHGCIKDQWPYPNEVQDAQLSQEPTAPSKSPNQNQI